jgi:hypothetical protein
MVLAACSGGYAESASLGSVIRCSTPIQRVADDRRSTTDAGKATFGTRLVGA